MPKRPPPPPPPGPPRKPRAAGTVQQVRPAGTVQQVPAQRPAASNDAPIRAPRYTEIMGSMDAGDDSPGPRPAWHLLHQLHTLMKAVMLHDPRHAVAVQAAEILCQAVEAMQPPFMVQFVAGGLFQDRQLVPLDFPHFEKCQVLTHSLGTLGAHELSFDASLGVEGAQRLGEALAAGMRGGHDNLKGVEIDGLSWREIPFAQSGIDAEGVDPEVAAIAHAVLGLQNAEQIAEQPDAPWPWAIGLSAVRRLEKGLQANTGAAMRGIEFAPEGWPVPRRAISAAMLVLQVLTRCNASAANRRAAAHATLALALEGLGPRGGVDLVHAADRLIGRMTRAPIAAASGVAPQCLLVASLVHLLGSRMRQRSVTSLMVCELIELAYEMERARCPDGVPFDLGRADLLAHAIQHNRASEWIGAIIKICGAVPVGACVQLADGRVGIVIEPGPPHAPWCPVVFIEGQRVIARQPVMLVPPTRLRRLR